MYENVAGGEGVVCICGWRRKVINVLALIFFRRGVGQLFAETWEGKRE